MPDENAKQRMARHIAAAWLAGALAGGGVAGTQSPSSPRLGGEAPPPAARLSLWYRAPASDHPLLTAGASREVRQAGAAEWVRALPVGNGRLGAMVFGGIVHERLQLNEDTLWAGRPYDPVNPDAKDALPDVRRLLLTLVELGFANVHQKRFELSTRVLRLAYSFLSSAGLGVSLQPFLDEAALTASSS